MNINLQSLIQACNELGAVYKTYHTTQNVVELRLNDESYVFINWTTPLNAHSLSQLCLDKAFFYTFFQDNINMPKTAGFLYPECDQKHLQYLNEKSYQEIVNSIENQFQYPLIVKNNRGSLGHFVFQVNERQTLYSSIESIFNHNSKEFDYVALAQDYIDIKTEYRVIYLNGALVFAYEKNIDNAIYEGNLSPLHWQGAKAILVHDKPLLNQIDRFCTPLFQKMMIPYCGLDVVIDKQGVWWLIEANSAPGFQHIINDGGQNEVIDLYKKMILFLEGKAA
ncbi:MAG: alpha-L-glutamate ligase [Candidatus Parabeggiatoa sp. nov. 3]|nr:MAG: alpha-L-glutamate ligase [Gammaproteobacteria bacterium]RKZ61589.1 MAG: alpha-L-glutamate ligase [Gammaproteobacteria bacterium]RKZ80072.1 MAG: alpha-L-glutamate ligase [Gammaproteobacteria bacterium]